MADDQVVTNIVARADFSDLIANVRKVTTSLAAMQQQIGSSNKVLSAQINAVNRSFGETLRSTGQFSSHFVSLANDVDTFGKRLDGGKLKLRDYFSTLQTHTRTSGGLIRDLARQQVQLQNAILQPLGRNAQGLMQFNVHVPQGLDEIKNKGALARQEMQILNKVMQEGAGQLINWGKNTQWAGRQLTVGLTVPIAAFGAAAAKAFREADQELTRLTKVYGGLAATSSAELQKVRRDVTAVANELARGYGASFKETLALSADIAATGKQGAELLGSIRQTTRLAVLGEVDRQDAMKATLAIQSAFKQDTDELAKSINFLNAVENQTSTTLNDLVEAIPKAGPVVKGLGGDIQDLALYLTAMKEGGINASEGANALKSALASLINPTDVAVKKFEGFGIDLMGIVNNNAGDVTKTLFALQGALNNLSPLQKSQAIEQLFGKFQFARLSALFENLGKQGSQTLKVMDLMKASSADLANIASRELSMVTESASGKYKRAVEGLKADLAGIGEEFLKVSTFFINLVDGIVNFVNKLPAPVKTILTFLAGLTAVTGPLIMLTGVLANFLGYVIKGAFHLKALFKGGEGWRMLTPEILAAEKAGSLIEKTFYSDAKAALALADALQVLSAGMTSIQAKMTQGVVSVQPMLSTVAGSVIIPPGDGDGGGGGGGIARVVDPRNPLVGPAGTRASAHMVPRSGMSQEERAAQTIHSFLPAPIPVNQAIGANPQIFASGDLPAVPGLTTISGKAGAVSTGVVASEAAKWHTMVGTLSMMTKQEVAQMKTQISTTGAVSSEFTQAFGALLPQMTSIAENAAQQSAIIVAEAKAGTISVETARQRIIQLNIQVEQLMAQATMGTATSLGRTAVITGVPTLDQPVVDPKTGKSNMRELFKKGGTRSFVDDLARLMGVRTWGAGYSTHTTIPIRRNAGGPVYLSGGGSAPIVPGPSVDKDVVPALLTPGEFVVNRRATAANLPLLQAINGRGSRGPGYNDGSERSISGGADLTLEQMRILDPKFRGAKPGYRAKGAAGTYGGPISDPTLIARYPYLVDPATGVITIERINSALSSTTMGGSLPGEVMLASMASRGGGPRSSSEQFLQSLARSGIISSAEASAISDEIHSQYSRQLSIPSSRLTDSTNKFWGLSDRIIKRNLAGNPDALAVWSDFSRSLTHHTSHGRRSTTARSIKLTSPSGVKVAIGKLQGTGSTSFLHSRMPAPFVDRLTRAGFFTKMVMDRAFRRRFNSGGMVPGYNSGDIVARGYNDSPFPVSSTTGVPITRAQFEQATGYPTLAAQMRASGELGSSTGSAATPKGSNFGMSAANIGGNILGFTAGSALGSKLSGGNQLVSMLTGLVASQVIASGLTKLVARMSGVGTAAAGAAAKTSLLTSAFRRFIALPGPLKLLGVLAGVGVAIKLVNDKIEEHKDMVSSGFGVSEQSAKKLGLQYKSLTGSIDEYQKKAKLANAEAAAFVYNRTKSKGEGIDITLPELEALKKRTSKDFATEIKMFSTANEQEAVDRATNLKAAYVGMGMSVENANELIYAMLLNSNKADSALKILGDEGFQSVQDGATAAAQAIQTVAGVLQKGNFDQLPIAITTAYNVFDNLQKSLINTDDKTKDIVTSSEAYQQVLNKINSSERNRVEIGQEGLRLLVGQNPLLDGILNATDDLASVWAKIKLSTYGINLDLEGMESKTAQALLLVLEKQREILSGGAFKTLSDQISSKAKASADQAIKSANITKDQLENQIKLEQKLIQSIKEKADARKKALDDEIESEDFLTQLKKKQIEYSEALASGDMSSAAQAQLDIQSMTGVRQINLAKDAIDNKANADIKRSEGKIEALQNQIDGLSKNVEKAVAAAEAAQKQSGDLQSIMDRLLDFVSSANDGISEAEIKIGQKLAADLQKAGGPSNIYGDIIKKYLTFDPTTISQGMPGIGLPSIVGPNLSGLSSLAKVTLEASKDGLKVTDPLVLAALKQFIDEGKMSSRVPVPVAQTGSRGNSSYSISPQTLTQRGIPLKPGTEFQDVSGQTWVLGQMANDRSGTYQITKKAMGGMIKNFMPGGNVRGPGTGTSDSIPAMLSNGEYVIKADSVKKYGTHTFDALNAGRFANGGIVDPNKVYLPDGSEARRMSREERNSNYRASRERFLAQRKKYKETPLPELSAIEWARKSGAILPYANGGPVNASSMITPSVPYYMKDGGFLQGEGLFGDRLGRGLKAKWDSYFNKFGKNKEDVDKAPGTRKYTEGIIKGLFSQFGPAGYIRSFDKLGILNPITQKANTMFQDFAYGAVGKPIEEILAGSGTKGDIAWTALNLIPGGGSAAKAGAQAAAKGSKLLGPALGRAAKSTPGLAKELLTSGLWGTLGKIDSPKVIEMLTKAVGYRPTFLSDKFKAAYQMGKEGRSYYDLITGAASKPNTLAPGVRPHPVDDFFGPAKINPVEMFGEAAGLLYSKIASPISSKFISPIKESYNKAKSVSKYNVAAIKQFFTKDGLQNFLNYSTPIGSIKALIEAKKAGYVASSVKAEEGLGLPIQELMKQMFYHGGSLIDDVAKGRFAPGEDSFTGNIFGYDFFSTISPLVARSYAVVKNAESSKNSASLYQMIYDLTKGKIWDMRGGQKSLWSQSKKAYIALEKYLTELVGPEKAKQMLLGERVPGTAKVPKVDPNHPFSGKPAERGLEFWGHNLEKAFTQIGPSGVKRLIDTIIHEGGQGVGGLGSHTVIASMNPENIISQIAKAIPGEVLQTTSSLTSDYSVLESVLKTMLSQFSQTGVARPLIAAGHMLTGKKLPEIAGATGGYLNNGTFQIPKFEKGINMVPANMLAMLHKNEAVVPANMNPFNPNAQSYSQPSISYNIAPVINAAPGMDEQAIANMATRQVLAEIKAIDSRNMASMGRPGMRVVGNK